MEMGSRFLGVNRNSTRFFGGYEIDYGESRKTAIWLVVLSKALTLAYHTLPPSFRSFDVDVFSLFSSTLICNCWFDIHTIALVRSLLTHSWSALFAPNIFNPFFFVFLVQLIKGARITGTRVTRHINDECRLNFRPHSWLFFFFFNGVKELVAPHPSNHRCRWFCRCCFAWERVLESWIALSGKSVVECLTAVSVGGNEDCLLYTSPSPRD